MAREAKEVAIEARDMAREAKEIATEARDMAREACFTAASAKQSADTAADRILKLQITVENEISRKIDAIGEGHDFLKMSLDRALAMEKEREKMWIEIMSLRMDVNKLKEKVDVA